MVLGDAGAFADLLHGLALTPGQRTRLARLFDAYGSALPEQLARSSPGGPPPRRIDLDRRPAEAEAALDAARTSNPTGGRTLDDIALRLADRAGRAQAQHLPPDAVDALTRFFALQAPLADAAATVQAFFAGAGIASEAPARLAALHAALGEAGAEATYDAQVHAPLGYYTGLEFRIEHRGAALAGGGRYDALVGELAGRPDWRVPAVGFALFLDAIAGLAP